MSTLVLDPPPPELEALKEKRRRLGQDLYDEVWEGVYRMVPAPHSRHGKVDDQLAGALRKPAETAGLIPSGPVNVGEADDFVDHNIGGPKARGFERVLGISIGNAEYLAGAIESGILHVAVSEVRDNRPYGVLCEVPILVRGLGLK